MWCLDYISDFLSRAKALYALQFTEAQGCKVTQKIIKSLQQMRLELSHLDQKDGPDIFPEKN